MKPAHGGKRRNAGRKRALVKQVKFSVGMYPDVLAMLDKKRGEVSRGNYLARIVVDP